MYRNTAAAIDVAEVNSPGTVQLSLWRVIHRDQIVAHGATSIASSLLQAPTKFETVFNLKDAKALSLQLEVQRGSESSRSASALGPHRRLPAVRTIGCAADPAPAKRSIAPSFVNVINPSVAVGRKWRRRVSRTVGLRTVRTRSRR
jgi:hypothetical protein